MSDLFSRVCMVLAVCLLAVIAFRSALRPARYVYTPFAGHVPSAQRITSRNPVYRVYETEPDANKIDEVLTKNWNEGQWELSTAPTYVSGPNAKVILVLVQR